MSVPEKVAYAGIACAGLGKRCTCGDTSLPQPAGCGARLPQRSGRPPTTSWLDVSRRGSTEVPQGHAPGSSEGPRQPHQAWLRPIWTRSSPRRPSCAQPPRAGLQGVAAHDLRHATPGPWFSRFGQWPVPGRQATRPRPHQLRNQQDRDLPDRRQARLCLGHPHAKWPTRFSTELFVLARIRDLSDSDNLCG